MCLRVRNVWECVCLQVTDAKKWLKKLTSIERKKHDPHFFWIKIQFISSEVIKGGVTNFIIFLLVARERGALEINIRLLPIIYYRLWVKFSPDSLRKSTPRPHWVVVFHPQNNSKNIYIYTYKSHFFRRRSLFFGFLSSSENSTQKSWFGNGKRSSPEVRKLVQ